MIDFIGELKSWQKDRYNDKERIGIGNFTMFVSINETINKSATITSNPIENGSFINDHIIKNPISLNIEGEVADVYVSPAYVPANVDKIFPTVAEIRSYFPERTNIQISKINSLVNNIEDEVSKVNDIINKTQNIYNKFTSSNDDITTEFLKFFDKVYEENLIIKVNCVNKIYENMAITDFSISKKNKTSLAFTINLQQIVIVETIVNYVNASSASKYQTSTLADKGSRQIRDVEQSTLSILSETLF